MKKLLEWIVWSSTNPDDVSMTVQGVLVSLIPHIITYGNQIGIPFSSTKLMTAFSAIAGTIGLSLVIVGGMRKIYLTISDAYKQAKADKITQ